MTFSSPFLYFVFLEWQFFSFALIVYLFVFSLTHWKQYFNLD